MKDENKFITSAIVDNRERGSVGKFLSDKIKADAKLSFVSAYFTIFAYHQLKEQLDEIDHLRFLFGEPAFIKSLGGDDKNQRSAEILDEAISISIFKTNFLKKARQENAPSG